MKITFLVTWPDAMGGTEHAVFTQAAHLAKAGHQVEILGIFRTRAERFFDLDPGVRIRYLIDQTGAVQRPVHDTGLSETVCGQLTARPSTLISRDWEGAFNRLSDLEAERALRGLDADVLVSTTPALMALATMFAPPGIVTVNQEHRVSEQRGASGEPLMRYAPRLDALVSLTAQSTSWFAETFGEAAPRLATIPNSIPAGFRPRSSATNQVIVMAGRMSKEKQVGDAVKAFAQVAEAHPGWVLRIFGDGPDLFRARKLANSLDVYDRVQFLGSTSTMAEEWSKAGIALHTSRVEAFGLVLAEAQAAGVPVVAYDAPNGPSNVVVHGETGFLVGLGDLDGLAESLGTLIEDEELRRTFGVAAAAAAERFSIETVMGEWERLYAELLAERADPGRLERKAHRVAAWTASTGGTGFALASPPPAALLLQVDAREHENRILASDRSLVRMGGQLCRLDDTAMPAEVALANLDLVVQALEHHDLGYWLLRDDDIRYRVAVEAESKVAAVAALAEAHADRNVYVETLRTGGIASGSTLMAALPTFSQLPTAAGLRVYQPVVTSTRTLKYAAAYGCDLEFWAEDEGGQDRVALRPTPLGATIPKAALNLGGRRKAGGRDYPTVEALTRTLASDVDFPIDVVYTWVDGDDEKWLAKKNATLAASGLPAVDASSGDARFRSRDELRYSLRSLEMFAPWVNHIWIVTDDQVPGWLDLGHPKITIVDHTEIFGDRGRLPTFNSHAIESRLHRIEGLAEHFLYINDDIFLGRPLEPARFFHSNGVAKHFQSPTSIAPLPVAEDDDYFFSAAKNNRTLIEKAFGATITQTFLHAPHPLRRDVLAEIEERFPAEVARTAESRFRSHTDIAMPSSLHHYYGYFTGRSMPGEMRCTYVNVGDSSQHRKLTNILTHRLHDAFCVNDAHDGDVAPEEQDQVILAFLEGYFPVRSSFEKP